MKIYFAGSIRGGRNDADLYLQMIRHLQQYGEVLTEHIGDKKLTIIGEEGKTDSYIHNRDIDWVLQSNVIVAEVTTPSLGVGYEIGRGVENNKNILCLYRQQIGKSLSAMIAGCPDITNRQYTNLKEAKQVIDDFFKQLI
jgi:2'-deoxynucleoside 5'-phosphate N-hydrolase